MVIDKLLKLEIALVTADAEPTKKRHFTVGSNVHCTTQTADAKKKLKTEEKLPFSVKIHVIFILNEITKDIILLLSHGLVLAMADD